MVGWRLCAIKQHRKEGEDVRDHSYHGEFEMLAFIVFLSLMFVVVVRAGQRRSIPKSLSSAATDQKITVLTLPQCCPTYVLSPAEPQQKHSTPCRCLLLVIDLDR